MSVDPDQNSVNVEINYPFYPACQEKQEYGPGKCGELTDDHIKETRITEVVLTGAKTDCPFRGKVVPALTLD